MQVHPNLKWRKYPHTLLFFSQNNEFSPIARCGLVSRNHSIYMNSLDNSLHCSLYRRMKSCIIALQQVSTIIDQLVSSIRGSFIVD